MLLLPCAFRFFMLANICIIVIISCTYVNRFFWDTTILHKTKNTHHTTNHTSIVNSCLLAKVKFDDSLHGNRPGRGTGTAIIVVQAVLLYGSETWTLTEGLKRQFQSFQQGFSLGSIFGPWRMALGAAHPRKMCYEKQV